MYNERREYGKTSLHESELAVDPFTQFSIWFKEAKDSAVKDATAMALSSVNKDGAPSSRIVLLKELKKEAFIFYTNYNSHKGEDIEQNSNVALLFFWPELERQIRIQGKAQKVSREESLEYFRSRPREAQLGAVASQQSQVLPDRESLEKRFAHLSEEFKDQEIPLPESWGGYAVTTNYVEFWQGRLSRLHDRLIYRRVHEKENQWEILRLSP